LAHGPVDLFVDLDEGQVGVGTEGEIEVEHGGFVAGAGADAGQVIDLKQGVAQGGYYGVFEGAGGGVGIAYLYAYAGDAYFG